VQPTLARFAPAKINLFLEILGQRPDGYHEIVTVMETIAAGDLLEAWPAAELSVVTNRDDVPSGPGNVAYDVVRAAEKALARPLPARITITKNIPPGSGLGAGSSDAIAALLLVLELHEVQVPRDRLRGIAASVGSDTAFFVDGGLALCTGRGEVTTALPQIGARHVVLVLPDSPCATEKVYSGLGTMDSAGARDRGTPSALLEALARGSTLAAPPDSDALANGLAAAAERAYPELAERRAHLERIARAPPRLSGSGGAFFFLCDSQPSAKALASTLRAADPALDVRETASYRGSG
jgi:4-diphosphocytidyl-2-C-methyl-D-erythritol kinase